MEIAIPSPLLPLLICVARIVDVSLGTLRTVAVVRGRVIVSAVLGFVEVTIWVVAISKVMSSLDNPLNVLGYAAGFALGNAIGIAIERRLAMGQLVMRIVSRAKGHELATALREVGLRVTEFDGRGRAGPVMLLYIMLERVDWRGIQKLVETIDPESFIVIEDPKWANRALLPATVPATSWRSWFKKK